MAFGWTRCPTWSSAKAPTTRIYPKPTLCCERFAPAWTPTSQDRLLLAEANQWPEDAKEYFGDGDECNMAFHFPLMPRMYMAIAREDRFPITDILRQTPDIPSNCQWAIFLRNHDELTLEMVTNSERDYLWETYAADRHARLNLGIRRRLSPLLERDRRRVELMNYLLLSMPGTPVIYYGDEIGMGDNIHLGDRDGVRTPMQWSPDRNGGFSRSDPSRLVLPTNMDPLWSYESVNVEAQNRDPHSLLNWTRRTLAVRRQYRVFGRGTFRLLYPKNRKVLAYLREDEHTTLLCVANLARTPQAVELDLSEFNGRVPLELDGGAVFPPVRPIALFADVAAVRLLLVPSGNRAGLAVIAQPCAGADAGIPDHRRAWNPGCGAVGCADRGRTGDPANLPEQASLVCRQRPEDSKAPSSRIWCSFRTPSARSCWPRSKRTSAAASRIGNCPCRSGGRKIHPWRCRPS